jgi:hypothetical protein
MPAPPANARKTAADAATFARRAMQDCVDSIRVMIFPPSRSSGLRRGSSRNAVR